MISEVIRSDEDGIFTEYPGLRCRVCRVALTSRNRYQNYKVCSTHGLAHQRLHVLFRKWLDYPTSPPRRQALQQALRDHELKVHLFRTPDPVSDISANPDPATCTLDVPVSGTSILY